MDKQKISDMFTQAMSEFIGERYSNSIGLLTEVLSQEPQHRLALTARGSAFMRQGNLDNAIADFDRAIRIDPEYARAYHLRGLALFNQGKAEAAMTDFDRAIDLDPDYAAAYYSRANLHSQADREEAAAEDAAMATQLGVRNLEVYGNDINIVRTQQMAVEDAMETELER